MSELAAAIAVFTLFHALPSTPLRARLIDTLGRRSFMILFSALSVVLFAWVWLAYRGAVPETMFWHTGTTVRMLSAFLVLAALMLLLSTACAERKVMLTAETVLGEADAVRGVLRITRHPMLWAIGLWGIVHMVNNPDPPSWLFFGYVTALALIGTWAIDRRRKRLLRQAWPRLEAETSNLPFLAIAQGRNRLVLGEFRIWPLLLAVLVWFVLLMGHAALFGMPVFSI